MNRGKTNICLNMIVKNETKVLERLFRSLKDSIDYYVIVDTGSADGTQQLIRDRMREYGIEGEIHERPWVDFGVNRQQALELAMAAGRADWVLIIDADEELVPSDPRFFEQLEPGVTYYIDRHLNGVSYALPSLLNIRDTVWCWRGAVHNYLERLSGSTKHAARKDVRIVSHVGEGAKSHGVSSREKSLRDARLLEEDLQRNPGNSRSQFYLAQSYRDAGELELAYEAYKARARLTIGPEETFMAQLECGRIAKRLGKSEAVIVRDLLRAVELRPKRAEPMYELATYFRLRQQYSKAYMFAKAGVAVRRPDDMLFIAQAVYDWCLLDELGVAAYWVGKYEESIAACTEVLRRAAQGLKVPEDSLARIRRNLDLAGAKLPHDRAAVPAHVATATVRSLVSVPGSR